MTDSTTNCSANAAQCPATQSSQKEDPSPITANWKYRDVSEGLDKHEESECRLGVSPEGLKIIGARVRGKKHKHEGTNCDDWFELSESGRWTIIAVADGAGSRLFSRVGTKVACEAAVKRLAGLLGDCSVEKLNMWSMDTFRRDRKKGTFVENDLEVIQKALHQAMRTAYGAIRREVIARAQLMEYNQFLERDLEVNDLSTTLLLAVHTTIRHHDEGYSLVLTCQVGDGMLAAVDHKGALQLLGVPDNGDFSGETEFLTSQGKLKRNNLSRKTSAFFSPLRALMVMTDGVADDYFPHDPGMLQLYGDLVLNQIVDLPKLDEDMIASGLKETKLPTLEDVAHVDFHVLGQRITPNGIQMPRLHSVAAYAEALGVPITEVVASFPLLSAGARQEPVFDVDRPEEKLQLWLDSYYVRGSFDDRTLVVLYRENLP